MLESSELRWIKDGPGQPWRRVAACPLGNHSLRLDERKGGDGKEGVKGPRMSEPKWNTSFGIQIQICLNATK